MINVSFGLRKDHPLDLAKYKDKNIIINDVFKIADDYIKSSIQHDKDNSPLELIQQMYKDAFTDPENSIINSPYAQLINN